MEEEVKLYLKGFNRAMGEIETLAEKYIESLNELTSGIDVNALMWATSVAKTFMNYAKERMIEIKGETENE